MLNDFDSAVDNMLKHRSMIDQITSRLAEVAMSVGTTPITDPPSSLTQVPRNPMPTTADLPGAFIDKIDMLNSMLAESIGDLNRTLQRFEDRVYGSPDKVHSMTARLG